MIRSRKPLPKDPDQLAAEIVRLSIEEPKEKRDPVSEYLAQIGRKGGLKGGKARASRLTKAAKKRIAVNAAKIRWKDHGKSKKPS